MQWVARGPKEQELLPRTSSAPVTYEKAQSFLFKIRHSQAHKKKKRKYDLILRQESQNFLDNKTVYITKSKDIVSYSCYVPLYIPPAH
jgi:hypothetical protein